VAFASERRHSPAREEDTAAAGLTFKSVLFVVARGCLAKISENVDRSPLEPSLVPA